MFENELSKLTKSSNCIKSRSVWFQAIESKQYNIVLDILKENPDFINVFDFSGRNIVHFIKNDEILLDIAIKYNANFWEVDVDTNFGIENFLLHNVADTLFIKVHNHLLKILDREEVIQKYVELFFKMTTTNLSGIVRRISIYPTSLYDINCLYFFYHNDNLEKIKLVNELLKEEELYQKALPFILNFLAGYQPYYKVDKIYYYLSGQEEEAKQLLESTKNIILKEKNKKGKI